MAGARNQTTLTIASASQIDFAQARREASKLSGDIARGVDPSAARKEKRNSKEAVTL